MIGARAARGISSSARDGVLKPLINPSRNSRAGRRSAQKGAVPLASRIIRLVKRTVRYEAGIGHIAP
eukprot:8060852-Heterocapsa_arctica.AAC.1